MMNDREKEAWGSGGPYEQYVGRWSRVVASEFIAWLGIPPGKTWGDIGCGTGALIEQIYRVGQPKSVYAVDRSKGFLAEAQGKIKQPGAGFAAADAAALPWADGCCDATISGLVLNFVPDAAAMVNEMVRVTRPQGVVAAYVWDYKGGMEMVRHFWDVAVQVDPKAAALDQGERFPLCQPDPLKELFRDAGLASVAVRAIDIPMIFRDFNDYWIPFLGKQGSAPTYLASVDSEISDRIRDGLKARLVSAADGSIHLTARAWAVNGIV
jgi:SAM-dependent methyltransferase